MDEQNFNNVENTQVTPEVPAQEVQPAETQTTGYYQDNISGDAQYQAPVYTAQPEPQQSGSNAMAIVSLVLGILSIVLACCYGIGVIFGIVGLILAIISRKQSKSGLGTKSKRYFSLAI